MAGRLIKRIIFYAAVTIHGLLTNSAYYLLRMAQIISKKLEDL